MIKNIEGVNKYNINIKEVLPKNFDEIVIACHGFGGDKESSAIELLSNELYKENKGVISFDFPGHGESEVDGAFFTIDNCISDLEQVEKYIKEKYGDIKISIFATSFGAYISLLKIIRNDENYNKIILRAPAIKMDEVFKDYLLQEDLQTFLDRGYTTLGFERKITIYSNFYKDLLNNKIVDLYNKKREILIIQGDNDNVAPIKHTIEFVEKNKEFVKLKILEGADHRMKKPGELDKVIRWSENYLKY